MGSRRLKEIGIQNSYNCCEFQSPIQSCKRIQRKGLHSQKILFYWQVFLLIMAEYSVMRLLMLHIWQSSIKLKDLLLTRMPVLLHSWESSEHSSLKLVLLISGSNQLTIPTPSQVLKFMVSKNAIWLGFHPQLKRLVEIGNSGIFRPEMLIPFGFDKDVRVIAWGLSLERPMMIQYQVSDIRDIIGHEVQIDTVRKNPFCLLGWTNYKIQVINTNYKFIITKDANTKSFQPNNINHIWFARSTTMMVISSWRSLLFPSGTSLSYSSVILLFWAACLKLSLNMAFTSSSLLPTCLEAN